MITIPLNRKVSKVTSVIREVRFVFTDESREIFVKAPKEIETSLPIFVCMYAAVHDLEWPSH